MIVTLIAPSKPELEKLCKALPGLSIIEGERRGDKLLFLCRWNGGFLKSTFLQELHQAKKVSKVHAIEHYELFQQQNSIYKKKRPG